MLVQSKLERFEGVRTVYQCQEAWELYEQLEFLIAWGASVELVERHRQWLDWELLVTYIED